MPEKAQISVFISLGLFILIIVGVFLYARYNVPPVGSAYEVAFKDASLHDYPTVEVYITSCLDKSLSDTILSIAEQFNNNDLDKSFSYSSPYSENVTIYYGSADIQNFEAALEAESLARLSQCINNFEAFNSKGYTINASSAPVINASINTETISAKLLYQTDVSIGNSRKRLNEFIAAVPIVMNS